MTERVIPDWMAHLYRDRRTGLPVPAINIWSDETDGKGELRPVVRHDPLVDGLAFFTEGRPGRGVPNFTRQHPARQRRSMIEGRCQVCDTSIRGDGWLPVGPGIDVIDTVEKAPGRWLALTEPWLCDRCADYAGSHCPGLIRRRRGDRLEMLRASPGGPRLRLTVSRAWVEGRLEAYTRRVQPVLWAKLLVVEDDLAGRTAALTFRR